MTDIIVPSLYLLSGACLYAGIIHFYAGVVRRDIPQIMLSGMAGILFLFAISHSLSLRAQDLNQFVIALKWSMAFTLVFFVLLIWFIALYTEKRSVYLLVGLSALDVALCVVNFLQPYSLQYALVTGLEQLRLPWGELITLADGANSGWFYLAVASLLVSCAYIVYALGSCYRSHRSGVHLSMMFGFGFLVLGLIQGVLVRLSIIHFVPLGWLGFLSLMVTMSLAFSYGSHQRLREKETKLRGLYELSPLGIALTDMQGRYVNFNEAFRRICGYSADELKTLDYWTLTPKEYAPQEATQLDLLTGKGYYGPYEKEYRRKDGRLIPIRLNGMLITGADGQRYIWSIVEDISEWKQVQNALSKSEERYRRIVETSSEGIWSIDHDIRTTFVNPAMSQMLGRNPEEILGRAVYDFVFEEDLPDIKRQLELHKQKINSQYELRFRHKDSHICWFSINSTALMDDQGNFAGSFAMFTDITERKRAEDDIRLAALVYQASSQAMMVTDADNHIITVNPAFTDVTCYEQKESLGQNPKILSSGRHDKAFYQTMWASLNTTGKWQGEIWNRRKNGEIFPEWLTINTIYQADGSVHRRVALFSDITKEKENEDLIWRQANFDMLTELPNRRMVYDRMSEEIKKIRRDRKHLAVLFVDLDRFKEVNDTLGHEVGDILLKESAQRMMSCVRDSDIIGRLGGDEFVIILNDLDDINCVGQIANKLLDKLATPYQLGIETAYISASIGISIYPDDATEAATLLKNADQAMYAAKRQGRNRFHYYTPAMQEAANARMRLTNDMHSALAENQFKVYYQPIVEMATGRIYKAEALVRWQHPRLGLVSPADFIPIAEDTGQIIEIGNWVFRQAAARSADFRTEYHPEFQISVNTSPVQFKADVNHQASWFDYLKELGLSGHGIVVEITEGLLMETRDEIRSQLLALRDNGMQIALDDFGTGYSSLSYLKKFDIDYLKIDQSFVRNLVPDSNDMALCEAMIVMAHKLGIKVIAEGVETQGQSDLLKQIGCDYGQGYLWSKPVPADKFEALLSKNRMMA
ncbi:EAL domain-containing protein [Methylomonas montana]|uniref:sensor domain-containing protein n=1 Tax=Methylomonas montana TaxID=3058963 RepID=UPI002657D727|nr:EAL domain-containing protein [Methylomonas montana]WKJ92084.1 EAL domain-containing protein [Methylomonas montana]